MIDLVHEKQILKSNRSVSSINSDPIISIDEMCGQIVSGVWTIKNELDAGAPIVLFKLKLFAYLEKQGLYIESVTTIDSLGNVDNNLRKILVINDMIIIEIATGITDENHHWNMMTDLKSNGYVMGLMIDFNPNLGECEISGICHRFNIH